MTKCKYFLKDEKKNVNYECDENTKDGVYCIFHDKKYCIEQPEEVKEQFCQKLRMFALAGKKIECIGYNIPSMKIEFSLGADISFRKTIFHGDITFVNINTRNNIDFTDAEFRSYVEFENCTFHGESKFDGTRFESTTNFRDIRFKNALFEFTRFSAKTEFNKVSFTNIELVGGYCKHIIFMDCTILRCVVNSITVKYAYFIRTEFNDAGFAFSGFDDTLDFTYCVFKGKAEFEEIEFGGKVEFLGTVFKNQSDVLFNCNLSKVSFLDTEISRVRFGQKTTWGGDGFTLVDEENLIQTREEPILGDLLTTYRNLRENYEYRLRYEEAGKFFVREMELKRNYVEIKGERYYTILRKNWINRNFSFIGLYYWLCKYGESYTRPFLWSIPILVASWIYWTGNMPAFHPSPILSAHKAVGQSVADFVQLKSDTGADIFFRILSAPILGTLFIAFRRKFERRFRH